MTSSLIEQQMESAAQDLFDDKVVRIAKSVSKMAAKQGGESAIENYKLLGKRALIVCGIVVVAVQVTTSVIGFVVTRKSEEQRIEQVVRRVLEEEYQEQAAE